MHINEIKILLYISCKNTCAINPIVLYANFSPTLPLLFSHSKPRWKTNGHKTQFQRLNHHENLGLPQLLGFEVLPSLIVINNAQASFANHENFTQTDFFFSLSSSFFDYSNFHKEEERFILIGVLKTLC